MVLEHLFAGAVMRHLWLSGFRRLEMLKPQVDDSGYDLVLEANAVVRHIQLKASHVGAATPGVKVNAALAQKPSGCVVWLRFDPTNLIFVEFLWFGGAPRDQLPDLSSFKIAKHSKANAEGVKADRPNIRYLPKGSFQRLISIPEVVDHLFGAEPVAGP